MDQHSTRLTFGVISAALAALIIVPAWIKSPSGQADAPQAHEAKFAAVVKSEIARAMGKSPDQAAELFAQASSLWVGTSEDWATIAREHGLCELDDAPQMDGKDVIVLCKAPLSGSFPSNRLAIKSKIEQLAADDHLMWVGLLDRPAAFNPLRSGFSVG